MGFPESCSGGCWMDSEETSLNPEDELWESYKLFDFEAFDSDESLDVSYVALEDTGWYLFDVEFAPFEVKEITNTYWVMPTRYKTGDWFNYVLETGASWSGDIGSVDVNLNFHDGLSFYLVDEISPSNWKYNMEDGSIEWHFDDLEPDEFDNIYFRFNGYFSSFCYSDEDLSGEASSYLEGDSANWLWYFPCKAYDGNLDSSWVEGASGDGVGEWMMVVLDPEKVYYSVSIFPGYGSSKELWEKNNRVKQLKFTSSKGDTGVFDFDDIYDYQDFTFEVPIFDVDWVKFKILDIYEGSEFDDTAIAEIIFNGLLMDGVSGYEKSNGIFSDVNNLHSNFNAINFLKDLGVINGYSDGSFKPNGLVNRAELMKMVVEMVSGDPRQIGVYENCFSDVTDDWYAPYVCYAKEAGWVDGYSDGTFLPAQKVNRAEAIKIILNAYYDCDVPCLDSYVFGPEYHADIPNDANVDEWYYPYIEYAALSDLLDFQHIQILSMGYNYFPANDMTRKEVAEMIYRLNNL
jgi:hypothetical protein